MTDPGGQRVSCTVTGGIADVALNRPDKHNALDPAMFDALVATGLRLCEDRRVRAVVLSGAGPGFCSGLDFASFAAMAEPGGLSDELRPPERPIGPARARGQQASYVWAEIPVPVIAAVHGAAFGGGLQVALGADIRIVAPDARLSVMEIRWGLVPDMTGSQLLPELVGRDVAKELTFTGREVSGEEASILGLATSTAVQPRAAALELAGEIATRSPDAVRCAKRLLDTAGRVSLDEGFDAEQRAIHALLGTPNQVEAIEANLAQRPPRFADPE